MSKLQNKHGSILAFASVAILAFVMLITQSIWMDAWSGSALKGTGQDNAIVGIIFTVLAIVALGGAFYLFHVKQDNKLGFIALAVALIFLIVSFAVPLSNQHEIYNFKLATGAASNVFLPNVIFFSLSLVGAAAGTGIYFLVK